MVQNHSIKDDVKGVVLESLKWVPLNDLNRYATQNAPFLTTLLEQGVITTKEIETSLEKAVLGEARRCYDFLVNQDPNRPDPLDVDSLYLRTPQILSYALAKGAFTAEEMARIPFDHGENAQILISRIQPEQYLTSLREHLLHPQPEISHTSQDIERFDGYHPSGF